MISDEDVQQQADEFGWHGDFLGAIVADGAGIVQLQAKQTLKVSQTFSVFDDYHTFTHGSLNSYSVKPRLA